MNPILAGVALAVIAGAIVVVSARDARIVVLAMAVVLVLSAVLADPLAPPIGLAARFLAAILAAYLLWIAARDRPADGLPPAPTEGSRIGWPAEILIAGGAAVVGYAADGLGAPQLGTPLASAAGFALAALAVAPVLTGRDILRVGLGLVLLLDAALLVRAALGGTPVAMEQLLTAGMLVAVAGVVAALGRAARLDGIGGFGFAVELDGGRVVHLPEAHPTADLPPPLPGDLSGGPVVAPPRGSRRLLRPDGTPRPGPFVGPTRSGRGSALEQPDLGLLDPVASAGLADRPVEATGPLDEEPVPTDEATAAPVADDDGQDDPSLAVVPPPTDEAPGAGPTGPEH